MNLTYSAAQTRLVLSLEALLYLGLFVLVLAVRVWGLDSTPFSDAEGREALAAFNRASPSLPSASEEGALIPTNALGAAFNLLAFTLFVDSDSTARLMTALAGVGVVLSPLLYRRWLGRNAALLMALGLALSPVLLLASRTQSGLLWSLLTLALAGWSALRFSEGAGRGYALAASVFAAATVGLTSPMGILLMAGILLALMGALGRLPVDSPLRVQARQALHTWPALEGLMAAGLGLALVATVFFTIPSGLASLGAVLDGFLAGLTQGDLPRAYALWVSLRYEFTFALFALVALGLSWRELTFTETFFGLWWLWGLVVCALYRGGTADLALILTVPSVGLTAGLVLRLLASAAYGFWQVPWWLVPLHTVVVAALLVSLGMNLQSISGKLWEETRPVPYAETLSPTGVNGEHVRLGALTPAVPNVQLSMSLPLQRLRDCRESEDGRDPARLRQDLNGRWCEIADLTTFTVQVEPLDQAIREAQVGILASDGSVLQPFERLGNGRLFVIEAEVIGDYRLEIRQPTAGNVTANAYFMAKLFQGDLSDDTFPRRLTTGAMWLGQAPLHAIAVLSTRAPNPFAPLALLMGLLFIPISFFLAGAFYGARAAWRGVAFGVLTYGVLMGWGFGLQASLNPAYRGDPRELWYQQGAEEGYHVLRASLVAFSRRETGADKSIAITVLGERASALGWALRDYPNAHFVRQLAPTTATPLVLAPENLRPTLGKDYVGQRLILRQSWALDSLNWVDFGAWFFMRKTKASPTPALDYRLWVERNLYGVKTLPAP